MIRSIRENNQKITYTLYILNNNPIVKFVILMIVKLHICAMWLFVLFCIVNEMLGFGQNVMQFNLCSCIILYILAFAIL